MISWNDIPTTDKHILDVLSIGAMVGTLAEYLPHVAAVFTIVWTGIRIYETETVQNIFRKNKQEDE